MGQNTWTFSTAGTSGHSQLWLPRLLAAHLVVILAMPCVCVCVMTPLTLSQQIRRSQASFSASIPHASETHFHSLTTMSHSLDLESSLTSSSSLFSHLDFFYLHFFHRPSAEYSPQSHMGSLYNPSKVHPGTFPAGGQSGVIVITGYTT